MVKNSKKFSKEIRALALVVNSNFQIALLIWLGFYGRDFMKKKYPTIEYWDYVIIPGMIFLCALSLYRLIAELLRLDRMNRNSSKDEH